MDRTGGSDDDDDEVGGGDNKHDFMMWALAMLYGRPCNVLLVINLIEKAGE